MYIERLLTSVVVPEGRCSTVRKIRLQPLDLVETKTSYRNYDVEFTPLLGSLYFLSNELSHYASRNCAQLAIIYSSVTGNGNYPQNLRMYLHSYLALE